MIQVRTKFSDEFKAAHPKAEVRMVATRLHYVTERDHVIKESLLKMLQTEKLDGITILDVQVVEAVAKAKPKKREK